MMSTSWPQYSVLELQEDGVLLVEDGNHGEYRPRREEFGEGQYSFIRAADMDSGRIFFETAERINAKALARIRKGLGKGGDILFSHKGTVGKLALAPLDAPPFVCSPQTTFWRTLDQERLDRRYLYCFMSSRAFTDQWAARSGETDMAPYVSLTAQRKFKITLPDITQQRAIAGVLGALDDKIEQNRRTAQALARLARAIFHAWFVDFAAVKAKAAGAADFPSMPQGVFDDLPARFRNSDLGPIPEGWSTASVYDFADVIYGAPFGSKLFNDQGIGLPLIRIRDLQTHVPTVFTPEQHRQGTLIQPTDIVVGMDGEFRLHYWTGTTAWLNQRVCTFTPKPGVPRVFLGESLRLPLAYFERAKTGTTVIHLGKADIDTFRILRPDTKTLEAFAEATDSLLKLFVHTAMESRSLAKMRDYLLPKLLSGEVKVTRDTEIGEAAE